MDVYHIHAWFLQKLDEALGLSPLKWVTGGCELPCSFWEPKCRSSARATCHLNPKPSRELFCLWYELFNVTLWTHHLSLAPVQVCCSPSCTLWLPFILYIKPGQLRDSWIVLLRGWDFYIFSHADNVSYLTKSKYLTRAKLHYVVASGTRTRPTTQALEGQKGLAGPFFAKSSPQHSVSFIIGQLVLGWHYEFHIWLSYAVSLTYHALITSQVWPHLLSHIKYQKWEVDLHKYFYIPWRFTSSKTAIWTHPVFPKNLL